MRELTADEKRVFDAVTSNKCITPRRLASLVRLPENKVRDILQRLLLEELILKVEAYESNHQRVLEDSILKALFYERGLGDRTAEDIANCIGKDVDEVHDALKHLEEEQKISRRIGEKMKSIYFFNPPN